jgi:hypothetical protein
MWSYKTLAIVMACWLVMLLGARWYITNREESLPEPPESIEKAYARIASAGLFVSEPAAGFAADRRMGGFTVSKTAFAHGEAHSLHLGRSQEDWRGKARVYRNGREARVELNVGINVPAYLAAVKWGDGLLVCGDPDFVREIVRLPGKPNVQNRP